MFASARIVTSGSDAEYRGHLSLVTLLDYCTQSGIRRHDSRRV